MLSYFRNCKHCGLGYFANNFSPVDLFCKKCWLKLEKTKAPLQARYFKAENLSVRTLYLWREKDSIVGDLIQGLKGGTPRDVLRRLTEEMSFRFFNGNDYVIVPVPPSKVGEKDHAFMMAKFISEGLGLPLWNGLAWVNKKQSQKFSSKTERFEVTMKKTLRLPTRHGIILVDDLITTGATILAAKHVIKSLNPIEVWTLACRI